MKHLLLGGSPCQHWSIAQSKNRETTAEGAGWELFKNYLIAKEKFKPDFFLYENNKSAAAAIKEQIAKELGYGLTHINSALVSAQNRQRFYVTPLGENIPQPEDRGILLRDVLETGRPAHNKAYALKAQYRTGVPDDDMLKRRQNEQVFEAVPVGDSGGKAYALKANYFKSAPANFFNGGGHFPQTGVAVPTGAAWRGREDASRYEIRSDAKSNALTADGHQSRLVCEPAIYQRGRGKNNGGVNYDKSPTLTSNGCWEQNNFVVEWWDGKIYPVYEVKDGLITIKDKTYPVRLADGFYIIRKLTCIECERLQTMPDNYTEGVSNSQRYKMLGNGWTAEIIIHILRHGLKDWRRDEPLQVLGMYDGMATGRYCLEQLGFTNIQYFAYEVDKYAIQIAQKNYPDIVQCGDVFAVREADWQAPDYIDARLNALLGVG